MNNTYLIITLIISLLALIFMIMEKVFYENSVSKINLVLKQIQSGDFNRRIHMGHSSKSLKILTTELNMIMDSFNDISEKKQNLEIAHKQLIANISHDLRTPLTSLLGYVEALQTSIKLTTEEREKYLIIIEKKGYSLYRLLQEFFELSKLESDDTKIKLEKVDLSEKIREVFTYFYEDIVKENLTPKIELPENPIFVLGNQNSIERILQNLLSNSIKYGKDGGFLEVILWQEQDKVHVEVKDRGKGIPEKDLKNIFERLFTSEPSRNEELRGSGLGLAIAKKLVNKMGGDITVRSIQGQETVFSFYLSKYN